jgi:hypothetical protein
VIVREQHVHRGVSVVFPSLVHLTADGIFTGITSVGTDSNPENTRWKDQVLCPIIVWEETRLHI